MAIGTISNSEPGGDVRGKLNLAIGEVNKIYKYQIPADSLRPLTANSAYYLESDVFPAQVFSETSVQGVKLLIPFSAIPIGTTPKFKIRYQAYHEDEASPTDLDVAWSVQSKWIADGAVSGSWPTAIHVVHTLDSNDGKLKWSAQSSLVTPSGTSEAGCNLHILIYRNTEYEVATVAQDTLDAPAYLYKIELEWEVS